MSPVLFELFGIPFFSYTFFLFIGIFSGMFIAYRCLLRYKLPWGILFEDVVLLFLISLVTGRIVHVFLKFAEYEDSFWSIFNIFDGGFYFWVVVFSIFLFSHYFLLKEKQDTEVWYDVLTPAFMIGLCFYFLGSFLAQKNIGVPTDLPWGIVIESPDFPFSGVKIHPLDLYLALGSFFYFIFSFIVVWFRKRILPNGFLFSIGNISLCVVFFVTSGLKFQPEYLLWGYDVTRIISLVIFIFISIHIILYFYFVYGKKKSAVPDILSRITHRTHR